MNENGFGRLLKRFRKRSGMTQDALARALDVDFTYISKIEGGKAPPPARERIAVAAVVLGLTPAERDELYSTASKLPEEIEDWVRSQPEAMKFYRSLSKYGTDQQKQFLEDFSKRLDVQSKQWTPDGSASANSDKGREEQDG